MFNWVLISLVASLTKVNHAGGQSFRPTDTSYPRYKRISPALDPYETRKCVPIPQDMPICNQMQYKEMWLPNFLQQDTPGEISDQLKSWEMLTTRCDHPELAKFICSLYTPVCLQNSQGTPEDMSTYMVPPCKQLCQSVYDKCYTYFEQAAIPWPQNLNCSAEDKFPDSKENKLCIPHDTAAQPSRNDGSTEDSCRNYCLIQPINADRKSDLDRLKEKFCAFDIVFQATIKRIRPDKGRKPNKNNVRITFERSDKEKVL